MSPAAPRAIVLLVALSEPCGKAMLAEMPVVIVLKFTAPPLIVSDPVPLCPTARLLPLVVPPFAAKLPIEPAPAPSTSCSVVKVPPFTFITPTPLWPIIVEVKPDAAAVPFSVSVPCAPVCEPTSSVVKVIPPLPMVSAPMLPFFCPMKEPAEPIVNVPPLHVIVPVPLCPMDVRPLTVRSKPPLS